MQIMFDLDSLASPKHRPSPSQIRSSNGPKPTEVTAVGKPELSPPQELSESEVSVSEARHVVF